MRRLVVAMLLAASCSDDKESAPAGPNAVELADQEALDLATQWRVTGDAVYQQQSSVDRGTSIDGGVRLLSNGNKDLNNWSCASPDAELGRPLVPAVFDLPSCPESYVRGAVAARFEGSGAMTRFWMTALSMRGAPADDEILRVYVDDELVVEKKVSEVADGTAGEMFAPPFGAGATSFVSWRYPVVFGRKLIVALDNLGTLDNVYHITNVALDRTPRARKRSATRLPRERNLVFPDVGRSQVILDAILAPGESREIERKSLRALSVRRPDLLGTVTLQASFDGVVTIDLPISELFAAWDMMPASDTLPLRDTAGGIATLQLPMTAQSSLRLVVTNRGAAPTAVWLDAEVADESGPGGRLWAVRSETLAPAKGAHPLFDVKGPGRYLGTCALLEGHATSGTDILVEGLNFLEGDERFNVDGVTLLGTGTEDYFDSAFYFLGGARSSRFAAWWGVREDRSTMPWRGRAAACRWHVLNDAIDFMSSIDGTLEIGNGDPSLLDRYRSVSYFYK